MKKHNSNSNRRNFGDFANLNKKNEKLSQNFGDEFYLSDKFSEIPTRKKIESYRFLSVKTTPKAKAESLFVEKVLCAALVAATIIAAICMCLAIASLFMFFSI